MQWKVPVGPVRSLVGWLEAAGCLVIEDDFETGRVDGLSQWVEDKAVIYLNRRSPTDRKRLTLAHELAHLCLHADTISDDPEGDANRFAAELLMPATLIRPQLRNLTVGRLSDLKREWMVSMQALIERAHELRTLRQGQRTNLYRRFSANGWRTREPASDELPPEHPRLPGEIGDMLARTGLSSDEIDKMAGFEGGANNPFRRLRGALWAV